MKSAKVLVLGDDTRSFLAIVRSLGRKNIEVHAAPIDFTSPALLSTYITRIHYLPFWTAGAAAWLEAVEELLRAERYDLVIPCNETSLLPLQKNRARLAGLTKLAIPDDRAISVLFDKYATRELALSVGAKVLPGAPALPTDDAGRMFAQLGTPLVLKPRQSYSLENLDARGRVRILSSPSVLEKALASVRPGTFFYEAFMPGRGVGISVLAHQGRILQAFEHHRVREDESGSYYRVSAPVTPDLELCCVKMVAELDYTGVAMFEFRINGNDGQWTLLEVNARPWGSLPLAVSAGIDFPYRWFQLLVNNAETAPVPYPAGVYGRNLVLDLHSTLSDLKLAFAKRSGLGRLVATRLLELGRIFTGREHYDSLVWDDPSPGLRELATEAAEVARRVSRAARLSRFPGIKGLRRRRADAVFRGMLRAGKPISVIFVCQGNICRSPFAASALEALGGLAPERFHVSSAGMLPRPGRPTPEPGIKAASARGIDLTAHRSSHLSLEEAHSGSIIVVFDEINRRAFLKRYPKSNALLVKLGDYAPSGTNSSDIQDPINQSESFYSRTYDQISGATKGLRDALLDGATPGSQA